jgi:glycosyltransferase involved in cell wall biosynthesis
VKTKPKVSVIVPVYNGAKYLVEAIDSALAQTYDNFEVIVVNDGSSDGGKTEEIALAYGDRIRYFSKPNGGVSTALNLGIREARGEYISWLSHDDVYYPTKLEEQIHQLEACEPNTIFFSDYDLIDEKSRYISTVKIRGVDNLLYAMFTSYPLNGCTMLIPKNCFETVGLFNAELRTTQDYDMWFRMLERFKFKHMATSLLKSRLHASQGSVITPQGNERNQLYIGALQTYSLEKIFGKSRKQSFQQYLDLSLGLRVLDAVEPSLFARNLALGKTGASKANISYLVYLAKWGLIELLLTLKSFLKSNGLGKRALCFFRRILAQ